MPSTPARLEQDQWPRLLVNLKELLGLGALLALPLFVLRALAVASYDADVATAIITNTTVTSLINAIILTATPSALIAAVLFFPPAVGRWATSKGWSGWKRASSISMTALAMMFVPFMTADVYFSGFLALIAALTIVTAYHGPIFTTEAQQSREEPWPIPIMISLSIVGFLYTLLLSPSMWLPAEKITVPTGDQKWYVLTESEDTIVVFDPKGRAVRRVPAKDITERQYCMENTRKLTIGRLLFGKPQALPECP